MLLDGLAKRIFESCRIEIHATEPRFLKQAADAADIKFLGEGSPQMAIQAHTPRSSKRLGQRSFQIDQEAHQRSVMLVQLAVHSFRLIQR